MEACCSMTENDRQPSRMEWSQRVEMKEVDDFELLVYSLKPNRVKEASTRVGTGVSARRKCVKNQPGKYKRSNC